VRGSALGELRRLHQPRLGANPVDDAVAVVLLERDHFGPGLLAAPAQAWALLEHRSRNWVARTVSLDGDAPGVLETAATLHRDGTPLAEALDLARALA
jgi:hypothetical protein